MPLDTVQCWFQRFLNLNAALIESKLAATYNNELLYTDATMAHAVASERANKPVKAQIRA
jgi:hypothetical protein